MLLFSDVEATVDAIIKAVGNDIRIGMPLGLGKPTQLINALYQRAVKDSSLHLTILTALSLEKPTYSGLEKAFLDPFLQRVFEDCPDLDYMLALRQGHPPKNVKICEFFFKPGSFLKHSHAQQNYISSNYTHAARDVFNQGCNVTAQLIAKRVVHGKTEYSLSCNPDTGPELVQLLKQSGRKHVVVGQVNENLPFMVNDALVSEQDFDFILDHASLNTKLFSTPKMAVTTPDYAIGLYASSLIKDGGTLQIGIGALGDAIVYAAQTRHQNNEQYVAMLSALSLSNDLQQLVAEYGGTTPFESGLYGATEMFVDGFMHLYQAGILKRKVYDDTELQRLLNEGKTQAQFTPDILDELENVGVRVIRTKDFEIYQHHGLFRDDCRYELGHIIAPDGERIMANLAIPESRAALKAKCLGTQLRRGVVLHGGFFLGCNAFYQALRDLTESQREDLCMTGVYKINQLDANPDLYKEQRRDARFINTGIMATLNGAVCSDGLANTCVVSGVGGQYNFVAMAHQLLTGRSILMIRAVRDKEGKTSEPTSNIVFNYGHITIPRHLRDIVITEYGVADLRSKTDSEVMKAMLNIADSRFQAGLLRQAIENGKIEADYHIPERYQHNTPEALAKKLARFNLPAFPLGCDLTADELKLGKALKAVKKAASSIPKWKLALQAWQFKDIPASAEPYLKWLKLDQPQNMQDKVVRMLLVQELEKAGVV